MDQFSRQLPIFALLPATVILLVALVLAIRKVRPFSGKFLLFIVWLRYIMQAFHQTTADPIVAGVSMNALASMMVCVFGFFVVAPRIRILAGFPFLCGLFLTIVASGLMNGLLVPTIETLLKWGYFLVVMLCVYDCALRDRSASIFGGLLWAAAPPLAFQIISVALGVSKATESDGSVSFIGGYSHEASFSVSVVTAFLIASLAPKVHPALRMILLAYGVVSVYLANYRTSLLAMAPMALGYFIFSAVRPFRARDRLLISLAAIILAIGAAALGAYVMRERLNDLNVVAASGDLIKPPGEFSTAEQKMMSGRLYLWNQYYASYQAGDDAQLILGQGPDAWAEEFGLYAHNTLVSYLYEFGAMGVLFVICIWASMIARALSIPDPPLRGQIVAAHIGFLVLNFATMPFWQIEGLILYGLLCGFTLYMTDRQTKAAYVTARPRPAFAAPLAAESPLWTKPR